jgi:DNA-binding ferritin-like protein (Dps family)
MKVDRFNKEVVPEAIEGYLWNYGKVGWRKQKVLNDE